MDENKEFGMEPDVFQPEPQRPAPAAFEEEPGYAQEEQPVPRRVLRGSMGTARQGYANFDPINLPRYGEDPYRPQYQPPVPVSEPAPEKEERKKKNLVFSLIISAVGVIVIALCTLVFFVFLDGSLSLS